MILTTDIDDALVTVHGAGLVPWKVLRWLGAVEYLGIRFQLIGETLCIDPALPPVGRCFADTHVADLKRVLRATPKGVM